MWPQNSNLNLSVCAQVSVAHVELNEAIHAWNMMMRQSLQNPQPHHHLQQIRLHWLRCVFKRRKRIDERDAAFMRAKIDEFCEYRERSSDDDADWFIESVSFFLKTDPTSLCYDLLWQVNIGSWIWLCVCVYDHEPPLLSPCFFMERKARDWILMGWTMRQIRERNQEALTICVCACNICILIEPRGMMPSLAACECRAKLISHADHHRASFPNIAEKIVDGLMGNWSTIHWEQ